MIASTLRTIRCVRCAYFCSFIRGCRLPGFLLVNDPRSIIKALFSRSVRRQIIWDILRRSGAEALVQLG